MRRRNGKATSLPEYYQNGYIFEDTKRYFTTVPCKMVIVNPDHFEGGCCSEAYRQVREYEEQKRETESIRRTVLEPFVGNAFRGMKESEYQKFEQQYKREERRKAGIKKTDRVFICIMPILFIVLIVVGVIVPKNFPGLAVWFMFTLLIWLLPGEYGYEYWSLRRFILWRCLLILIFFVELLSLLSPIL